MDSYAPANEATNKEKLKDWKLWYRIESIYWLNCVMTYQRQFLTAEAAFCLVRLSFIQ